MRERMKRGRGSECGCPSIDFYLCFMGRKMIEPTEGDNRHEPKTTKCHSGIEMRIKVLKNSIN